MCGIFGWITGGTSQAIGSPELVSACFDALHHRGPDDRGVMFQQPDRNWSGCEDAVAEDVPILLGHVRLSILDLSPLGKQPMVTPDGRFRLTFNGEVYNYRELRSELESLGITFTTRTDTEVVLHAFAQWGLECMNRFTGMFAMAVHDDRDSRLYLIRDHFGIKPLFYATPSAGQLIFSSELPLLLLFPTVSRRISAQRVYDYLLFGDYDSHQNTMVDAIQQLPPAHYMVIDCQSGKVLEKDRYWKPELQQTQQLSFSEATEQLRGQFLDNVRLHLRSDVPLGSALSGGIDSSAVCCAIRELEPNLKLPTFTFIAPGSEVDEEHWANQIASHIHAEMYKVQVDPHEMVADLDDLIRVQGEPFGSTSIYAQYRVFRLAKECGVKVTLDGQGADEMLAGYLGFPGERLKTLLMQGNIVGAWRFFNATSQWPDRSKSAVFKRMVGQFTPRWLHTHFWAVAKGSLTPPWLDKHWLQQQQVKFETPQIEKVYSSSCYVRQALAQQLTQRGLPGLLRHGDRNSMRFSIESRVPFLTREMVEFLLSLPEEHLIAADGTTKSVFRQAMRGMVPDAVLDRRDKIGFATPEKGWLKSITPWVEETLADAGEMPVFHAEAIRITWGEVMAGRRPFDWQVWRWLNFIRWAKQFKVEFS